MIELNVRGIIFKDGFGNLWFYSHGNLVDSNWSLIVFYRLCKR